MGVAIPTVLAGPGTKFTANVIILQGQPMGSFLLSAEDVTTTVGRDKGESRKGNEKRRVGGFCRRPKEKKKKGRGKKEHYVCFQNHRDFPCWFKAPRGSVKTCQTLRCPLLQPGFRKSDYKSVTVWNGGGGVSVPWSTRGREPAGLLVLPSRRGDWARYNALVTKERNPGFSKAGEGGGRGAVHRRSCVQTQTDLCNTWSWLRSEIRAWHLLQMWAAVQVLVHSSGKLSSAFIPSDTFSATLFKALTSSEPWILVCCKIISSTFSYDPQQRQRSLHWPQCCSVSSPKQRGNSSNVEESSQREEQKSVKEN